MKTYAPPTNSHPTSGALTARESQINEDQHTSGSKEVGKTGYATLQMQPHAPSRQAGTSRWDYLKCEVPYPTLRLEGAIKRELLNRMVNCDETQNILFSA